MDSNHRRHSQQIYSLPHLATLVTTQKLYVSKASAKVMLLFDLGSLKDIDTLRASLIAISEDGVISENERPAFQDILDSLEKISTNAKALKLWAIKNIHIQEEDV